MILILLLPSPCFWRLSRAWCFLFRIPFRLPLLLITIVNSILLHLFLHGQVEEGVTKIHPQFISF